MRNVRYRPGAGAAGSDRQVQDLLQLCDPLRRAPEHEPLPGLPGAPPVLSRQAVKLAVHSALALNCQVLPMSRFARKNYFYPDLPKGYQISQCDEPLAEQGWWRLSEREIATVKAWVDAGAAEGNPKHLPPPPRFTEGWQLGKPDIVIDIGEDHAVTPGEDAYEHFVVPTNLSEGKWIRAAEIRPGNRRVVHHVHVLLVQDDLAKMEVASTRNMPALGRYLVKEGKLTRIRMDAPVVNDACAENVPDLPFLTGAQEGGLAAFLPGRPPDTFPEGTAKWVPAGAKLEFVVHYAKIEGKPQTDRTSVGLYLAPGPPERVLRRMDLRNFFMAIPAGAANHEVKRCYTFERDKLLLSFTPHMHYRGKDITYELVRPNGKREILMAVPRYDFNWQLVYRLKEPVRVEKGSRLIVTAHYDNSANNRADPDPGSRIRWGDKSEEEMMTSWIEYLDAPPAERLPASAARR